MPCLSTRAGTPYFAATYPAPRSLSDLPRHPINDQHPFVTKEVRPPYGYAINLDRSPAEVMATIRAFIDKPFEPV